MNAPRMWQSESLKATNALLRPVFAGVAGEVRLCNASSSGGGAGIVTLEWVCIFRKKHLSSPSSKRREKSRDCFLWLSQGCLPLGISGAREGGPGEGETQVAKATLWKRDHNLGPLPSQCESQLPQQPQQLEPGWAIASSWETWEQEWDWGTETRTQFR